MATKTMKDTWGDPIEVSFDSGYAVYLTVTDGPAAKAEASLTAKKARKLARLLKEAADVAEGKE